MNEGLTNKIRRYVSLYDRGLLTAHEFVKRLFDLYAQSNANAEDIAAVLRFVPDELMETLYAELHAWANADFYRRTFGMGDTRAADEVHADALARQPALRRIYGVLMPLVRVRMAR
jgi:hypothetical protein